MRALLITALFMLPTLLFAAPGVPHQLHGSVSGFTSGTISAVVDGAIVATGEIANDGTSGKSPNFFFVEDANGTFAGKSITFKINDAAPATGSVTFINGGLTEVQSSLVIIGGGSSSIPTPTQIVSVPSTPSNPFDPTGDGIIDIQDFNYFIAHWGDAETDFNGDGAVDVLDFNLLMANWS